MRGFIEHYRFVEKKITNEVTNLRTFPYFKKKAEVSKRRVMAIDMEIQIIGIK